MRVQLVVRRAPVTSSTSSQRYSRALTNHRNTVMAPISMAVAPLQVRWSVMREISLMITRANWARRGGSTSNSFSTAMA